MYGIFAYIWLILKVQVGNHTIPYIAYLGYDIEW